jgi:hypothetical protein
MLSHIPSKWQGNAMTSGYRRYHIDRDLHDWINHNIAQDWHDAGISLTDINGGDGSYHTDRMRDWALIWLIDTGGPSVDTVFYQQPGQSLHRSVDDSNISSSDLIRVSSTRIKKHQWCLLNARAIHRVENTVSSRIGLQIGFWDHAESLIKIKQLV